ncbi:uncharacterized protein PHALS_02439 [Plasmopara halstedii]|uniref:Uncharacterized protein n=1 Tax=Plasmopara halstedii TaxID=4781 RepID=A0A0P1A7U1_PLAHL|nr:uncharacterized protein PHALS_02439 [Plasmopara halstedii]CEG36349.1 hypothetical protein PHALS_02439 [Plasmopara halstedii]|eukprot:XP_024572718.1 hypothetical protein PHALS_02439 [Plasmopara halstedii]
MRRVAVLSHVKESTAPPSQSSSGRQRVAWQGGKIVSNKEEAIRKFYQRKLRAGDQLTAQQIETLQTLSVKIESDAAHKQQKKVYATHRPHAKVTASGFGTVLKTGRVLGPKIGLIKKKTGKLPYTKLQASKMVANNLQKRAVSRFVSLEDKLDLPLDALVNGKNKRGSNMKRK